MYDLIFTAGNTSAGILSTIGGGSANSIESDSVYATIAGGHNNIAMTGADGATIGGGSYNSIQTNAHHAFLGGGEDNHIYQEADHTFLGGGEDNSISYYADHSVIGGGYINTIGAYSEHATIGGGKQNFISSSAAGAVIPGGFHNTVAPAAYNAWAGGTYAEAYHPGAFVWSDATYTPFYSTRANEFSIRANGGVRIDSGNGPGVNLNAVNRPFITRGHDPFTSGNYLGAGRWGLFMEPHNLVVGIPAIAGKAFYVSTYNADSTINQNLMNINQAGTVTATAFNPTSDRTAKENFVEVSPAEVLEKVAALPITRWNFRQDAGTEHIGPMAQDFHAAFGLGTDDRHIATVDADGVALAAIQGLNQKLERENAELRQRLDRLEKLLAQNLNGEVQ